MRRIDFLEKFNNFLIILMIFSGSSRLASFRLPLIAIITIGIIAECCLKKKIVLPFKSSTFIIYNTIVLYALISFVYTYDFVGTFKLFIVYIGAFFLWNSNMNEKRMIKLKNYFLIATVILSISIVLSVFIDDFMFNFFKVWIPKEPGQLIMMKNELKGGIYSGLACERAEAAYLLNIGMVVILSNVMGRKNITRKEIVLLILFILSIMLTGKRSLILIPIIIWMVLYVFSGIKNKCAKGFIVAILGLLSLLIAINIFPAVQVVIDRFTGSDSLDSVYDRIENYWAYAFEMFDNKPLLGYGLGTFKSYISNFRNHSIFNAHNIYIQVFAESGLLGATIYIMFFYLSLRKNICLIKKYKKENLEVLYFVLGMQVLFLIYGITGNNLFTYNQLFLEILCIAILDSIQYKKEIIEDE